MPRQSVASAHGLTFFEQTTVANRLADYNAQRDDCARH
jgi:hypothetical protein